MQLTLADALRLSKVDLKARLNDCDVIAGTGNEPLAWYFAPTGPYQAGCLVAHIDTVWDRVALQNAKVYIYYDSRHRVLWSPQGLGADDRAGVAAAFRVRQRTGCAVLLCDGEESGGWGAHCAIDTPEMFAVLKRHSYLLGLDRRGVGEFVCYCQEPKAFKRWIRSFGLNEAVGTFSDTYILTKDLHVPSANLAVGYLQEHSIGEHLIVDWWRSALHAAVRIITATPPAQEWAAWKPAKSRWANYKGTKIDRKWWSE